jgi:DNA repair protein RecN (Recombination protein N)
MLIELRVENLLLIETAELRLAPGLNVITGETGAGKTVLAHALDLLLGGRARPGIVRPGSAEAYVEGSFELPADLRRELGERLPVDATEVVLARRVGADGRTRAYLNGRSATVGELRDLGASLVSFYGQHEHRKLTISAAQLALLDERCGPEHARQRRACAASFEECGRLQTQLEALQELSCSRESELDLLDHELAEIDGCAELCAHEELLAARERLRRLDALRSAAGAGADALASDASETPGAVQLLAAAAARLEALTGIDERLDGLAERLRALVIESQDLAGELGQYGEAAEREELAGGELALEQIEERLSLIERLVRKHGGSAQAVLEHAARARARREELLGAGVALGQVTERLGEARAALQAHVGSLRLAREAAAPDLARAVREQLSSLAMGDASFEVILSAREIGRHGGDSVEFLIAPNPGVGAGPLREVASGGELSRVMLAIMSVAGAPSTGGTIVFDEVDAGIGGHTARAVGARLRELGEGGQVLCITHLPQIASLGDRHFSIAKDTSADPTCATVLQLEERAVVAELVRMLGAEASDTGALRHARELRRAA